MTTLAEGIERRFWEKVDKRGPDECWEWRGTKLSSGHGAVWDGTRVTGAHRLSLRLAGVELGDLWACHRCNNPSCVNPSHLYAGTRLDNVRDAVEAGAYSAPRPERRGEKNPLAKLTEQQVAEIRERYGPPPGPYRRAKESGRKLAKEYGVSLAAIQKIAAGRMWAHVDVG